MLYGLNTVLCCIGFFIIHVRHRYALPTAVVFVVPSDPHAFVFLMSWMYTNFHQVHELH